MDRNEFVRVSSETTSKAFSLLERLNPKNVGDQLLLGYATRVIDLSESVNILVRSPSPNGVYPIIRSQFEALCDLMNLKAYGEQIISMSYFSIWIETGAVRCLDKMDGFTDEDKSHWAELQDHFCTKLNAWGDGVDDHAQG